MTTELTKVAQQALEACPFCGADPQDARHIEYGRWAVTCRCGAMGASASTGPNATDAAKIKAYNDARTAWNTRALTQRPAAQSEAQALAHNMMLWREDAVHHGNEYVPVHVRTLEKVIAQLRDMPAPQQATPERHLTVTTNQQGEAVMVSWQDDEHRILEVVWERKQATPEPCKSFSQLYERNRAGVDAELAAMASEATPEPVGEPDTVPLDALHAAERERDYWKTRARAMLDHAEGTCWYWMGDGEDHLESLVNSLPVVIRADQLRELLARPAPGVPEGWTVEQCLKFMCVALRHVEYKRGTKGPSCDDIRLGLKFALAAAQAKGVQV